MLRITDAQRKARLGRRHRLANPAGDVLEATRSVLALHSSDPVTVYLSSWARVPGFQVADLEGLLYEDRSLFRFYGMRRTLWVIDRATVPLVHNSSTRALGRAERRRTIKIIEDGGIADDGAAWLDDVVPRVLELIRQHGEMPAREITRSIPELAEKITYYNKAGRVMGAFGMTTRTLTQLALESRVIRARPVGSWISSQYRWAEMTSWLGGPIEDLSTESAGAELVGHWLRVFGPGTETDLRWWTGWPVRQVRSALAKVSAVEVEMTDGNGYLHPEDLDPVETPRPWVALLPSLDPTTMGWKERTWFLGDHAPDLFDRNGNAGPTIWANGQVVGGWTQRKTGEIVYELLEDVGREIKGEIESRAADLQTWLGEVNVNARFRTPMDRRLSS